MVEIRQATTDDMAAQPLIYSAAPEYFEYVFTQGRKTAMEFIAYSIADGRGFMGANAQHVALIDGQIVGNISLYSRREYKQLSDETGKLIRKFYGTWGLLRMVPKLRQTQRWMVVPNHDTDYVANLGVSPAVQGQGVGTKMLKFGLEQAKARGKKNYALDVAVNNPDAERLYRRFGMEQEYEAQFHKKGIVPATRRLLMSL